MKKTTRFIAVLLAVLSLAALLPAAAETYNPDSMWTTQYYAGEDCPLILMTGFTADGNKQFTMTKIADGNKLTVTQNVDEGWVWQFDEEFPAWFCEYQEEKQFDLTLIVSPSMVVFIALKYDGESSEATDSRIYFLYPVYGQ